MDEPSQLRMFGLPEEATGPVGPADPSAELTALAAALSPNIYLGTSSWTFPGWEGLVYDRRASEATLRKHGLRAYAKHPLLRTVGVDRTYYAPVEAEVFERYVAAVPDGFRFLVKAHEDVTVPWFAERSRGQTGSERGGGGAGSERSRGRAGENERFLDPDYATERVVRPFVDGLGAKAGPLLFQFPPMNTSYLGGSAGFVRRLRRFLAGLPRGPLYAFELRNRGLLTPDYADTLAAAGAVHCLNAHPSMPPVLEQARALGPVYQEAPAVVVRWMLARDQDYASAKARYQPFNSVVDVDPRARAGIAGLLVRESRRPCYVVVNNKAEGSSPLSIRGLAEQLAQ